MKSDLMKTCGLTETRRPGALGTIAMRFSALEGRFPSASKGFYSIFDQAVVSGASFLTAVIIGRLTTPDELGLYYLAFSIVMIVSGVQEQVIAGPYMVLSKRRHGRDLAEYGGSVWLHHLVLTVLVVGGFAAAIAICTAAGNTTILPALWALLGAGPLMLLRDGIRRFTLANLELRAAIALDATVSAAQLGGLLSLALLGKLSLASIFGVMGGACLLACLGWFLLDPPRVRFRRARLVPDWRHNWVFGQWALWSYAVGGTASFVMLWILGLGIDASATAMLGVCTTLIGMTNVILSGVANVLTPLAAKAYATGGAGELRHILSRAAAFIAIVVGSVCLVMLACGGWLVVLVFGTHYQGVGAIPFVLAASALMTGLGMVAGNGLWAIHRPRAAFIGDFCGMFAMLIAVTLLILPFGVLGAALAILAGSATAAVIRIIVLARVFAGDEVEPCVAANTAFCPEGT